MRKLLLLTVAVFCASIMSAQSVTLTNIQALDSYGNVVQGGSLYVTWGPFQDNNGTLIPGGAQTALIRNGVFSITLTASDNAGWPYNALIMGGAQPAAYLWKIPAAGGVTSIRQIGKPATNTTSTVTLSGVSSTVASLNGTPTPGTCAGTWDSSGNLVPSNAPCSSGTGGVGAGITGQFAFYPANGSTVAGHSLAAADIPALNYQTPLGFTPLNAASNLSDLTNVPAAQAALGLTNNCVFTKYPVNFNDTSLASASAGPKKTLITLSSTSSRICGVEISGVTSFLGIPNLTAATVRLQSSAATPLLYSPNQDIFGTVGATTNNYWSDSGSTADRTASGIVAAFTFTCSSGNCFGSSLTAGSVNITVGVRAMP